MGRKRWTPQTEITDSVLKFREKRKWQIALRRYVLEKNKSSFYAPYFGLDIAGFRRWLELQFDADCTWDNFSECWQLEHVVPIACFNFEEEEDLRLCWNFTNIRIEKIQPEKTKPNRIDVLAAKAYFEDLYHKTAYPPCGKMVEKINEIERAQLSGNDTLQNFLLQNKTRLETILSFSSADYDKLNTGTDIADIVFEKEFLKKFG